MDYLGSPEHLDLQVMLDMARLVKRVSEDSRVLRVLPEVLVSREWGTPERPDTGESPESPVPQVSPAFLVFPERKAKISPALFPERWETPVILVSRGDQVLKVSLEPMGNLDVLVMMELKEREETAVSEANQDDKVSQDLEEMRVSQVFRGPVMMEAEERMVFLVFPELRASPERFWGPLLGLLGLTDSLGPRETRACLGRLEDLVHLVWTGGLVFPG